MVAYICSIISEEIHLFKCISIERLNLLEIIKIYDILELDSDKEEKLYAHAIYELAAK